MLQVLVFIFNCKRHLSQAD